MNQKMCYLMKGPASSRLTTIYPTTSLRPGINIALGNVPVKSEPDFILVFRLKKILAFDSSSRFFQMNCRLKPTFASIFRSLYRFLRHNVLTLCLIIFKRGLQITNESQNYNSMTFKADVCDFFTRWI